MERANRRRGVVTLYFKKKSRLDWPIIQLRPVGKPLHVVQDSVRAVRAPPHCILPNSKESHRGRGRYHVIMDCREFCNYEGDVLGTRRLNSEQLYLVVSAVDLSSVCTDGLVFYTGWRVSGLEVVVDGGV